MKNKDFDLIAENLYYRLFLVKSRYAEIDPRHVAILEIENLINQLADSFRITYPDFKYHEFLKKLYG